MINRLNRAMEDLAALGKWRSPNWREKAEAETLTSSSTIGVKLSERPIP